MEQVKKEEAEQGYNDESSDNDSVTEETKEEREERYAQPLEIDLSIIRKKAAEIMGIPESDLPIAKAEAAAKALAASNPPGIKHNSDGTTSEIKTEVTATDAEDEQEESKKAAADEENDEKAAAEEAKKVQKIETENFVSSLLIRTENKPQIVESASNS